MNFSQLQERLRVELLRRIDRGSLNGALLARQTGFQPSHISNFLRRRRTLSLAALDRLLAAQLLTVHDLLALDEIAPVARQPLESAHHTTVPIVTAASAIHDPTPPLSATQDRLQLPLGLLDHMRTRRSSARRSWVRFLALRVTPQQSAGMLPQLPPESIAVLDRHYNSLVPYHPPLPSLFAVRMGNALLLRFAEFNTNRLILRPIELSHPLQLVALGPHEMPSDLIVARVCLVLTPLP
jgi:hypothetical protein